MTGKAKLLAAAARLLSKSDAPSEAVALARDLFAAVDEEDLAGYSAAQIAAFARSAAEALQLRPPGAAFVRIVEGPPLSDGGALTLVEIVNDNMAFLVDSTLAEIRETGHDALLVAHPILSVERDRKGRLRSFNGPSLSSADPARESLMQIHLGALSTAEREALAGHLEGVLSDVRLAVTDWQAMVREVEAAILDYENRPPPIDPSELREAIAFLRWLAEGNFTILGLRHYDFVGGSRAGTLRRSKAPGLGILSDPSARVLRRRRLTVTTTPEIRDFLLRPEPLIVTKANLRSRVHRRGYMDYVGVKRYSQRGRLIGETRLVGLLTSASYHRSVRDIPYLRRKVEWVEATAGLDPASHSGKALFNVLETYPRDELFQIEREELRAFALAILRLDERPRSRVFVRRDRFARFLSILVFVPRDRYGSDVRRRIGDLLAASFNGRVSHFEPAFLEGPLVRVHFIIGRDEGEPPNPSRAELEDGVLAIIRTWADAFLEELHRHDHEHADPLFARYAHAFPQNYRDDFTPARAIADVRLIETLSAERPTTAQFYRQEGSGRHTIEARILHLGPPMELSRRVPVLENLGFRVITENTYRIEAPPGAPIHVHDMRLETADHAPIEPEATGPGLLAALEAQWQGLSLSDAYDALILQAGLGWRDVALLRTISRFLRQAGIAFSETYMAATMNRHPALAAAIVRTFHARLAPPVPDTGAAAAAEAAIVDGLAKVPILDEDRIIRSFAGIVRASLRTNYFQHGPDGRPKAEIALKLDSRSIAELPDPKPYREIFLSSPRVEAVHLRFGKIARGGIRWSDRPEDFRTEVLGLVKAQQVKNAVIVPVGAKGGFFPRQLAGLSPDLRAVEGRAAYRIFMETLLDLTDNIVGGQVMPPEETVRVDEDDPYLVVAADKGTATYSDLANEIAVGRGFWLGDAFASGGSAGFDHKAMAITARGAFESVKRHFREMNIDIATRPFTVAGVGDMSGDVFGNGMLLLPTTRLVAAFDHRDIFLDPNPDPAASLAERRRLFQLPRSSWQDYERGCISPGGGIFSRLAKAIPLSTQIRELFDLPSDVATPAELIRAVLRARVDLLWFGGIGTYVKASTEPDLAIGDHGNDALRVTAGTVRAKVIGEGANLAVTDKGRVEYSLARGHCNSDAIDNSAGVNTSDVEVNIKIALAEPLRSGRLKLATRNRLLAGMTEDVAALVLRNNYLQPLAISLVRRRRFEDHPFQLRLMQGLEARGLLDRRVENLPDDAAMAERAARGQPLTRPEIGLLLAHAKLSLFAEIIQSGLPDDPAMDTRLVGYFPPPMRKRFLEEIRSHQLRREIIATVLSNQVINRAGPTFLPRVADRTGASTENAVRAFLVAHGAFAVDQLHSAIDQLDGVVPGLLQLDLYAAAQDLLLQKSVWFVRNGGLDDLTARIAEFGAAVDALRKQHHAGSTLAKVKADDRYAAYVEAGVPATSARVIADLPLIAAAPDIHIVAAASDQPLERSAEIYFGVGETLLISRLEAMAGALELTDYYEGVALDRGLRKLAEAQRAIGATALSEAGGRQEVLERWQAARRPAVDRVKEAIRKMVEAGAMNPSKLAFAADLLTDLASS